MPVPDFSPGEVLTAAAMDSIGLWKVTSASAASGSILSIENCFSANFDAYRVILTNVKTGGAVGIDVQLANSGTPAATSYYWNYVNSSYVTTTSYSQQGASNTSNWGTVGVADSASGGGVAMDIFNPFLVEKTVFCSDRTDPRTTGAAGRYNGYHNAVGSYSGLYISVSGTTFSSITATVYGYRK